jgi:hypothetical protein
MVLINKKIRYLIIQLPGVLQFLLPNNSFIRYVFYFTALRFISNDVLTVAQVQHKINMGEQESSTLLE